MLNTVVPADANKGSNAGSFRFKPHKNPDPLPDFATLENQVYVNFDRRNWFSIVDFEFLLLGYQLNQISDALSDYLKLFILDFYFQRTYMNLHAL